MNKFTKGWFSELSPMWPGQSFSLQIKKCLLDKKSQFQHIQVFETETYGRMLTLDGVIQATERDECSYQEMITYLPVNCHPNPQKVLIIGGGDGGVARELDKHPKVKQITQCEIDKQVIEASKEYIPSMGCGFNSKKLTLLTGEGAKFLDESKEKFDVIITDASDPVVADDQSNLKDGPAASLFNEEYYEKMKDRLNDNGILCCQGENMWLHADLISKLIKSCSQIYPVVDYAYTCTPSYPSGQIGFILCSKNSKTNFKEPVHIWTEEELEKLSLKYYNADIHRASFVLPNFMKNKLK